MTTNPEYADQAWNPIDFKGATQLVESQLMKPFKRKKPTVYFVCSMGDFHHPSVKQEWKDKVMSVVALCPRHTFIFLTKRAKEQREYINDPNTEQRVGDLACKYGSHPSDLYRAVNNWPLPNVYLGTTVENQEQADERIPALLATPAAKRFVYYAALGPVAWRWIKLGRRRTQTDTDYLNSLTGVTYAGHALIDRYMREDPANQGPALDCIIAGGETGPGARPPHPKWFRDTRDQCAEAGVDFFFEGWGDWGTAKDAGEGAKMETLGNWGTFIDGEFEPNTIGGGITMVKVGKKAAGRLLYGRKHNELPWRAE